MAVDKQQSKKSTGFVFQYKNKNLFKQFKTKIPLARYLLYKYEKTEPSFCRRFH